MSNPDLKTAYAYRQLGKLEHMGSRAQDLNTTLWRALHEARGLLRDAEQLAEELGPEGPGAGMIDPAMEHEIAYSLSRVQKALGQIVKTNFSKEG